MARPPRLDGTLDTAAIGEFWAHVLAVRPEQGFAFGMLDIEAATIPNLESWPGSPDTLELLRSMGELERELGPEP